jgi:hypothetical protein
MDVGGGPRAGSGAARGHAGAKTSSSSCAVPARACESPTAAAAAASAGADTKTTTEAALRDLDLLLEQLQSEKRRMTDRQKEDEVDSLTRQMVEAMGSQEEIKWNATIKREVADFGKIIFVTSKAQSNSASLHL